MRKVGYSVGLESLLEKVTELTNLYAESRSLSYEAWVSLVEDKWHRKSKQRGDAAHHYANFYGSLDLLKVIGKTVHPLFALDTLSILRRYFADDPTAFQTAARLVLAHRIVEADGEVFLNALAAQFDPGAFRVLLEQLIQKKREAASRVFRSKALLQRIFRVIDIGDQATKGQPAAPSPAGSDRFFRRTQDLSLETRRSTPIVMEPSMKPSIPDDYLRKVPQTRKGWARDLGLFGKDELSDTGKAFLVAMADQGLRCSDGPFIFWPYPNELLALRIRPEEVGAPAISSWQVLCAVAKGLNGITTAPMDSNGEKTLDLLLRLQHLYREGNLDKGSIRHQLPLYIAQPCLVAISCSGSSPIPPLPQILEAEFKKPKRRVNLVNIRGTEGGLAFPKAT